MDTRSAHHLSDGQISAINSVRALTLTLEDVLRGQLKRGTETAPQPVAVREVFEITTRLRDSATLAICNHPHR